MKSNAEVINAWRRGRSARSRHLRTDGLRLWSYDLLIGFTGEDNYKYVKNYTKHPDRDCFGREVRGQFVSATTSRHVGLARRVAYAVEP